MVSFMVSYHVHPCRLTGCSCSCKHKAVCDGKGGSWPFLTGSTCMTSVVLQTPKPWTYVAGAPYGEYLLMEAAAVRLRT